MVSYRLLLMGLYLLSSSSLYAKLTSDDGSGVLVGPDVDKVLSGTSNASPLKLEADLGNCPLNQADALECEKEISRLEASFETLKEGALRSIKSVSLDLGLELDSAKIIKSEEFSEALVNYRKSPNRDGLAWIMEQLKVKKDPEYNCQLGPDALYFFDRRIGRCQNGFTMKPPYIVKTKELEASGEGAPNLVICQSVSLAPYAFKMCGKKDLSTGKIIVDQDSAVREVREIKIDEETVNKMKNIYHAKLDIHDLSNNEAKEKYVKKKLSSFSFNLTFRQSLHRVI